MLSYDALDNRQLDAINFLSNKPHTLLVADVGTGKTVIACTAALDAIKSGKVRRWLVLAPLLVARDTWGNEVPNWHHLADSPLKIAVAVGDEKTRIQAIEDESANIVVLNYENLSWLLKRYPIARRIKGKERVNPLPFDGCIFDELDKLKDVSSTRFKDFRKYVEFFSKTIGMTATPVPNNLIEVWGQTYAVFGREVFPDAFTVWRSKYFYPTDYKQYNWQAFEGTRDELIEALKPFTFRLKAQNMADVVIKPSAKLIMDAKTAGVYRELSKDFIVDVEGSEIEAVNAAVLQGKLQQICAGFSYVDDGERAIWYSKAKFDWLDKVIKKVGAQVMVLYHFREEREELARRYPKIGFIGSGTPEKTTARNIRRWNDGELKILALHPASAGHGLNLQHSGAHHIAFLTVQWSGGLFRQVIGRLRRRGQQADKIFVHTAVFEDTVDEKVLCTVLEKLANLDGFNEGLSK